MSDYVQTHCQYSYFKVGEAWTILSDIEQSIKQKVESVGTPLKDWDIEIYRGVLTGYNEAFIISSETREAILDNCKSHEERQRTEEIIRPILRGRDIRRYSYDWASLYLIWVPWHFPLHQDQSIQGASTEAEQAFLEQYPSVYHHLLQYKDKLSARNRAETGIRYEWYALQRWGSNYWDLLSQPKIIWGEISDKSKFCIDRLGEFAPEATTFMLSGDNLLYLLAFLNCSISEYLFSTIGTTTGVGTVRWKKYKILELPIPRYDTSKLYTDLINACKNAVETHEATTIYEKRINSIIYQIYGLTEDEIGYIEWFTHGK